MAAVITNGDDGGDTVGDIERTNYFVVLNRDGASTTTAGSVSVSDKVDTLQIKSLSSGKVIGIPTKIVVPALNSDTINRFNGFDWKGGIPLPCPFRIKQISGRLFLLFFECLTPIGSRLFAAATVWRFIPPSPTVPPLVGSAESVEPRLEFEYVDNRFDYEDRIVAYSGNRVVGTRMLEPGLKTEVLVVDASDKGKCLQRWMCNSIIGRVLRLGGEDSNLVVLETDSYLELAIYSIVDGTRLFHFYNAMARHHLFSRNYLWYSVEPDDDDDEFCGGWFCQSLDSTRSATTTDSDADSDANGDGDNARKLSILNAKIPTGYLYFNRGEFNIFRSIQIHDHNLVLTIFWSGLIQLWQFPFSRSSASAPQDGVGAETQLLCWPGQSRENLLELNPSLVLVREGKIDPTILDTLSIARVKGNCLLLEYHRDRGGAKGRQVTLLCLETLGMVKEFIGGERHSSVFVPSTNYPGIVANYLQALSEVGLYASIARLVVNYLPFLEQEANDCAVQSRTQKPRVLPDVFEFL